MKLALCRCATTAATNQIKGGPDFEPKIRFLFIFQVFEKSGAKIDLNKEDEKKRKPEFFGAKIFGSRRLPISKTEKNRRRNLFDNKLKVKKSSSRSQQPQKAEVRIPALQPGWPRSAEL